MTKSSTALSVPQGFATGVMRYPQLVEMMQRNDPRPPLKVDKSRINFDVLAGVVRHLASPDLIGQVHAVCGEGVNLHHYAVAIWGLKARLNNAELDAAWNAMMDGLAPRPVKAGQAPLAGGDMEMWYFN